MPIHIAQFRFFLIAAWVSLLSYPFGCANQPREDRFVESDDDADDGEDDDDDTEDTSPYGGSLRSFYQDLVPDASSNSWAGFAEGAVIIPFDGELTEAWPESPYDCPNSLFLSDVNDDGRLDIVIDNELLQNSSSHIVPTTVAYFILNEGNGVFSDPIPFEKSYPHEHISDVADVTKDGHPDIISYSFWNNGILVYEGLGDLQFAPPVEHSTSTHGGEAYVVDMDGDGERDIVAASSGSAVELRYHQFADYPESRGDMHQTTTIGPNDSFHNHFVPFVLGDRRLISYVAEMHSNLGILADYGDGWEPLDGTDGLANQVIQELWGDWNSLSDDVPYPHFFVRENQVIHGLFSHNSVFFSTVGDTVEPLEQIPHGLSFTVRPAMRLRDINRDGLVDLVGAVEDVVYFEMDEGMNYLYYKTDKLIYHLGDANWGYPGTPVIVDTFADIEDQPAIVDQYSGVTLGDLDGDGFEDLVVLMRSYDSTAGAVRVYFATTQ